MVDLVTRCHRYPNRGETIGAESFTIIPGGKGANQAVACAKMGCETSLIGAVGTDPFAKIALGLLDQFGVHTKHVFQSTASATGTATIIIDGTSDNTILVSRGANSDLGLDHLECCAEIITQSDALLVQLEINLPIVQSAMRIARDAGVPILLDPAPAQPIPDSLLALADFVTPNAQETKTLTDVEPDSLDAAVRAAEILHCRGARQVIIKRGPAGCLASVGTRRESIDGIPVKPVDTVGAGDCFAGAFMARWLESRDLFDACRFANVAASLKVQRFGAQSGIPSRPEVDALFHSLSIPENNLY